MAKKAQPVQLPEIVLQKTAAIPLSGQLYAALRCEIISGRLRGGQRLPSTRVLAQALCASRNTVLGVFERLTAEGYLVGRVGSGTRVARPRPHSYLAELPRIPAGEGRNFRQMLRQSCYPASTASLRDSEGNAIYLFTCN
jgi:GntR family transcriptional regulator/MocR family aminotransferase